MEEVLLRFLQEIGAWTEIDRSFREYLIKIEERGIEFANSSIVLPLKYDHSMFTNDFRKVNDPKIVYFPSPFHFNCRLRRTISHRQSTLLRNGSEEHHTEGREHGTGQIVPKISSTIRTGSFH